MFLQDKAKPAARDWLLPAADYGFDIRNVSLLEVEDKLKTRHPSASVKILRFAI